MKRRHFLRISIFGAAAAGLPIIGCNAFSGDSQPLSQAFTLGHFCDEEAIREIGMAYQAMDPTAKDVDALRKVLLVDILGPNAASKQTDRVPVKKVKDRVTKDFSENLLVAPAGWVISRTEARQCALFTLTA
jgi:hypothetical protein